jgi:hypothetical protein
LDKDEVLETANLPLAKLAKVIGDKAPKEDRKKISQEFVDACVEAGIVTTSQARHTLS